MAPVALSGYNMTTLNTKPTWDAKIDCPAAAPAVRMETQSSMWIDDIKAECKIQVWSTTDPKVEIVTLVKGTIKGESEVAVRVHSECFTGDIVMSKRCDCGQQLHKFLRILDNESNGVLMYVRGHEGRGIGLANKIKAYRLQDQGLDTVDANLKLGLPVDTRTYEDALVVLQELGIKTIRLFTNNPEKSMALASITHSVVPLPSIASKHNLKYLTTKRKRCNHRTVLDATTPPAAALDSIVATAGATVGIVYTTYNKVLIDEMVQGVIARLDSVGAKHTTLEVPGANELVSGARLLIKRSQPDALIVLGVMITDDNSACSPDSVVTALTDLTANQDTPIIKAIMHVRDLEEADRALHGVVNPPQNWADEALRATGQASDRKRKNADLDLSAKHGFVSMESQSQIWVDDIEDDCKIQVWSTSDPKVEFVTIVKGSLKDAEGVPTRVHSECFTGDIIGSQRCDCGQQLHNFLRIMNEEERGVLMYVRGHEGRGIGLANKIRAYKLQDEGFDTVDANSELGLPVDARKYEDALSICRALGLKSIRLYTNNPDKSRSLASITHSVVSLPSIPNEHNRKYLTTKKERCAHLTVLNSSDGGANIEQIPAAVRNAPKLRVGVVYAWNQLHVESLLRTVTTELDTACVKQTKLKVSETKELVSGVREMIQTEKLDAVVVLGAFFVGSNNQLKETESCPDVVTSGLAKLIASQDVPIITALVTYQEDVATTLCGHPIPREDVQSQNQRLAAIESAKGAARASLRMAAISVEASS